MPPEDICLGTSPTHSAPAPTLSQPKPQRKIIRVLTVMAYMLSVSMAAILLSIYYIFVWNGSGSGSDVIVQQKQKQPLASPFISLQTKNNSIIIMGGLEMGGDEMGQSIVDSTVEPLDALNAEAWQYSTERNFKEGLNICFDILVFSSNVRSYASTSMY